MTGYSQIRELFPNACIENTVAENKSYTDCACVCARARVCACESISV